MSRQCRVLIVDRASAVARLMAMVLDGEGYCAVVARDQAEALRVLAADPLIDAVLSAPFFDRSADAYMWLDQVRAATAAPIIICTRDRAVLFRDYRERGYEAMLGGAFSLKEMIALVTAICGAEPSSR